MPRTVEIEAVPRPQAAGLLVGRPCPMHPERLAAFYEMLRAVPGSADDSYSDGRPRIQTSSSPARRGGYEVRDGVALLPVAGLIVADQELQGLLEYYGVTYTDPYDVARLLDQAAADRQVRSVLLVIDSPGGIIDGVQAAADAVWAFRQDSGKPVDGYTRSLNASAAYWIGALSGAWWSAR